MKKQDQTGCPSQAHEGHLPSIDLEHALDLNPEIISTYKKNDDDGDSLLAPSFIEVAMVALAPFVVALAALLIHSIL